MNNKIKIALVLAGAGTLLWQLRKKQNGKKKVFTAPDGNTYKENQMYRTFDNKVYQNGKEIRFNTPVIEQQNLSSQQHSDASEYNTGKNYQNINKNPTYHQKGVRHH